MKKKFKLSADEIKRMIPSIGAAIATDMIMVNGNKVDYMSRQQPEREDDSGWMFYGGGETQEYIDNPNNMAIYDVNTVANYDPDIIPFLTYPPGTEIERNADGKLELITENVERPSVVFLQPIVGGKVTVAKNWSFEVSTRMLRRVDEGSLVIWKPEFTIWLDVYSSNERSVEERLNGVVERRSEDAFDFQQEDANGIIKVRYYLIEKNDGEKQASAYIFGFVEKHEIHISIYYDSEEHLEEINNIWKTMKYA